MFCMPSQNYQPVILLQKKTKTKTKTKTETKKKQTCQANCL